MTRQEFQEAIVTEKSKMRRQLPPFIQGVQVTDTERANYLMEVVPGIGAEPAPPIPPIPVAVEEQYRLVERRAFPTTTTPQYYDLLTPDPKVIVVQSESVDHYVDWNQQIDATASPKVFANSSYTLTARGVTRLWFQAVTATGTIRIQIFAR